MEKTKFLMSISQDLLKNLKIQAIVEDISVSQMLERLAKEYLQKVGK